MLYVPLNFIRIVKTFSHIGRSILLHQLVIIVARFITTLHNVRNVLTYQIHVSQEPMSWFN